MIETKRQPNWKPTRKMFAVMVSGALASVVNIVLGLYIPQFATPELATLVQGLAVTITALIMSFMGYAVKDNA